MQEKKLISPVVVSSCTSFWFLLCDKLNFSCWKVESHVILVLRLLLREFYERHKINSLIIRKPIIRFNRFYLYSLSSLLHSFNINLVDDESLNFIFFMKYFFTDSTDDNSNIRRRCQSQQLSTLHEGAGRPLHESERLSNQRNILYLSRV